MDYKKIFKKRKTREFILRTLRFLPDKFMLKLIYRVKLKRKLNLKNPKRFSEKIQWLKLNYRNPIMIQITDKYDVRGFVEKRNYSHILNECYGVYNSFDEIDFSLLPNQFVVKDTLGSGSVSVYLVKDKNKVDLKDLEKTVNKWISKKNQKLDDGREWAYRAGKKHRIIIEKYLKQKDEDLVDYKFLCFNGEPYVIAHDKARFSNHQRSYFDVNWKKLNVKDREHAICDQVIERPENFKEMIKIAKDLSQGFPLLRVDLYNIEGKIVFGELTCYPYSGLVQFEPDEFDYLMGEKIILQKCKGGKNGSL